MRLTEIKKSRKVNRSNTRWLLSFHPLGYQLQWTMIPCGIIFTCIWGAKFTLIRPILCILPADKVMVTKTGALSSREATNIASRQSRHWFRPTQQPRSKDFEVSSSIKYMRGTNKAQPFWRQKIKKKKKIKPQRVISSVQPRTQTKHCINNILLG